jgi:hypothetical protein
MVFGRDFQNPVFMSRTRYSKYAQSVFSKEHAIEAAAGISEDDE